MSNNGDLEKAVEYVIQQLVIAKSGNKTLNIDEVLKGWDERRGSQWFDDYILKSDLLEALNGN